VPLLPFLFTAGGTAVATSAVLGAVTLFGVGGAMSILTGKHLVLSGIRMLLVGSTAAGITYLVGHLLNATVT
jgi:VIT1/CCC1 family predicted Fe2+/Mn2+ transporter